MSVIICIRGLPGAGKTTLAKSLRATAHFEADDYFLKDGEYRFDARDLAIAHQQCQENVFRVLTDYIYGNATVIVANTFTRRKDLHPYRAMALDRDTFVVIDLFDVGLSDEELATRGTPGVPVGKIAAMRAAWERL